MKLYPKDTDHGMFIIAAFRYTLGRQTYAVGCITKVLIDLVPELKRSDKNLIFKEIHEAIDAGRAGMDFDVKEWEKVADVIAASI